VKKIGFVVLALVIAVGALGVGYAMWSDTLTINGTVKTGTVDIDIEKFSSTWVWKRTMEPDGDPAHDKIKIHDWHVIGQAPTPDPVGLEEFELISSAKVIAATLDPDGTGWDAAEFEFDNLFPNELFFVDFLIHYNGSIPARCAVDFSFGRMSTWLEELYNAGHVTVVAVPSDADGNYDHGASGVPLEGVQMHNCDYYVIKISVFIPQLVDAAGNEWPQQEFSGREGSMTLTIEAQQWNEYPD
jgi:predicted ribosomally synthesized peptide with SipW-like signal peptide